MKPNKKNTAKRKKAGPARSLSVAGGYAVCFRKQIHGSFSSMSSMDVELERSVILPIPPCIGLEVSDGEWAATITALWVDLEDGITFAITGDDKEIYEAQLRREAHRTIEEITKEYTDSGWVVRA